jgi:hypothetical protein
LCSSSSSSSSSSLLGFVKLASTISESSCYYLVMWPKLSTVGYDTDFCVLPGS